MARHYRKNVRRSQIISPFGIGSIVDFPREALMPAGLDAWPVDECQRLTDRRLAERLNIRFFLHPPVTESEDIFTKTQKKLPFVRFPLWHLCSRCRSLTKANWNDNYPPKCKSSLKPKFPGPSCGELPEARQKRTHPVRFVVACSSGHVEDFPWVEWVHTAKGEPVKRECSCDNPTLRFDYTGKAGLMGLRVICENCEVEIVDESGATQTKKLSRSLIGAANPDTLEEFGCSGARPWLGPDSAELCKGVVPKVLQRGATNFYFSKVSSSILIPPYSAHIRQLIDDEKIWSTLTSGMVDGELDAGRVSAVADLRNVAAEQLRRAIKEKLNEKPLDGRQISEEEFRFAEYSALIAADRDRSDDDLVLKKEEFTDYSNDTRGYLSDIVLVEKLAETRALVGFSRIEPPNARDISGDDLKRLSLVPKPWVPAIRAFGEGIFIKLDENAVNDWSNNGTVKSRASMIQAQYHKVVSGKGVPPRPLPPKFFLLHSLAHSLIRRLAFDCGYGSSSLRERIYCSDDAEHGMSGLLVYTAAADSEGTMGGLVRLGKPGRFDALLRLAILDSLHCSADPLCAESHGQGTDSLNLSACHACSLLPETACEEGNRLLDRSMLIGSPEHPECGYFSKLVDQIL